MGTLCHVARYPERLWALVCLLIDKHEEKFGYSRSLSQPVSIISIVFNVRGYLLSEVNNMNLNMTKCTLGHSDISIGKPQK